MIFLLVFGAIFWVYPQFQRGIAKQTIVVIQGGQEKVLSEVWSEMTTYFKVGGSELRSSDKQFIETIASFGRGDQSTNDVKYVNSAAKFVVIPNVLDPSTVPDHPHPLWGWLVHQKCIDFILIVETEVHLEVNGKTVYKIDKGYMATTAGGGLENDVFFSLLYSVGDYLCGQIAQKPEDIGKTWQKFEAGLTQVPFTVDYDPAKDIAGYSDGTKITVSLRGEQRWFIYPVYRTEPEWLPPAPMAAWSVYPNEDPRIIANSIVYYDQSWEFVKGKIVEPDFLMNFTAWANDPATHSFVPVKELIVGRDGGTSRGKLGLMALNGFKETVSFSAENVPAGLTITFTSTSWTPSGESAFGFIDVFAVGSQQLPKDAVLSFTIRGKSASVDHTLQVSFRTAEETPSETLHLSTYIELNVPKSVMPSFWFMVTGKLMQGGFMIPIANKDIYLTSSWDKATVKVTTDSGGFFSYTYYAPSSGIYTIEAEFKGDAQFGGCVKKESFRVESVISPTILWIIIAVLIVAIVIAAVYAYRKRQAPMATASPTSGGLTRY